MHYQTLSSAAARPLAGCHYWKLVHHNASAAAAAAAGTAGGSDDARAAGEPFRALPIYPLFAAISNKNNQAWLSADQADNMELLRTIRGVAGEEEICACCVASGHCQSITVNHCGITLILVVVLQHV